jgi:hypothetical protein
VASVWIRTRKTKAGETRHRVEFRVGGRDSKTRFAGSFKTKRLAVLRAAWLERELAEHRVPDVTFLDVEAVKMPTLGEASEAWRASRVDVDEDTGRCTGPRSSVSSR